MMINSQHPEEITTIFVVGFPDDMLEREFQNMFIFSPGFEAATLKIPNKDEDDGNGHKKQIIGFAKFRTRLQALEARDILSGRKVDAEKGCVLKAEMAKKNLHTKRGLSVDHYHHPPSSYSTLLQSAVLPNHPGMLRRYPAAPSPYEAFHSVPPPIPAEFAQDYKFDMQSIQKEHLQKPIPPPSLQTLFNDMMISGPQQDPVGGGLVGLNSNRFSRSMVSLNDDQGISALSRTASTDRGFNAALFPPSNLTHATSINSSRLSLNFNDFSSSLHNLNPQSNNCNSSGNASSNIVTSSGTSKPIRSNSDPGQHVDDLDRLSQLSGTSFGSSSTYIGQGRRQNEATVAQPTGFFNPSNVQNDQRIWGIRARQQV
ncbi:hypothetical protein BKA69DRAFT_1078152 [Paraphysoderma sedebokerense]|nr:hypothetical protein BKA69DRAFT_1078152 [Paraphysoderma sedebokerense]